MAGDEAGNGPPRPEDGPANSIDPGDALTDAHNNPCTLHVAPPCYTPTAQAAASDDPLCRQAGGHGTSALFSRPSALNKFPQTLHLPKRRHLPSSFSRSLPPPPPLKTVASP
ncbi:hypothetical protein LIER_28670 [Lithospermum erythrorhizon]|uniref:Uncharacterized protein n=1 Tax=Lithospermum erythrorhizon TaxID=34254 RepID=A0AAV3RI28_LITER